MRNWSVILTEIVLNKGWVVTQVDTVQVLNETDSIFIDNGMNTMAFVFSIFSANSDYIFGRKLSKAFSKYEKLGYYEMADPLDDEKEDEKLNSGITVHSSLGSWKQVN